ncbi:MAG: class I SAM-dependent methyltransferase, partial [Xanthomonadales bacterium]|nr:class I SAM-dependent methyltransferase [Xanthomonadales bacterium]
MTGKKFEYEDRQQCICGEVIVLGSDAIVREYAWGPITFKRCAACGTWAQSPMVAASSLTNWVESDDYRGSENKAGVGYVNYAADEASRLEDARIRYRRDLMPILPERARVLEVGCASGSMLAVMREHGHEVSGVDLSRHFVEAAHSLHGLDVICGDVLEADLPNDAFDLILLLGTISNFRALGPALERLRRLLRPRGALVFNFPDAASLWVTLLYRERFWMYTPSVFNFMTQAGVAAALRRAGFVDAVF